MKKINKIILASALAMIGSGAVIFAQSEQDKMPPPDMQQEKKMNTVSQDSTRQQNMRNRQMRGDTMRRRNIPNRSDSVRSRMRGDTTHKSPTRMVPDSAK